MGTAGNGKAALGWVKASEIEQMGWEKDTWSTRITEIPSNMGMRVEYDANDNAVYVGYAPRGLAEGTDGWLIQKFAYDASGNATSRTIAYGNWTNRALETYA